MPNSGVARMRVMRVGVVLAGLGLVALGFYSALFAPKPHHGDRHAIAVVQSVGGAGKAATVSLLKPDGTSETVELRDAARRYEELGTVNVLVDNDNPAVVYDANGGRSNVWLFVVIAGLVLILTSRYVVRAATRIGANRDI